jgi:glycosyltransferase involved in cell wall biosynthesis
MIQQPDIQAHALKIKPQQVVVALDIDPLGLGFYNPHERTGVYRVVESLANGLDQSECRLQFYAEEYLNDVLQYLKTEARYRQYQSDQTPTNASFSYHLNSWLKKQARQFLTGYYEGREPYRQLVKLYRKMPFKLNRMVPKNESSARALDGVLREANVFHSPYSPITEHVDSFRHLKHFLTIHDLIPLISPWNRLQKGSSGTKAAVESLKPHHWAFTVSQATKNDLCNYRKDIDPNRVLVNPLGASKEKFFPCRDAAQIASVKARYGIPAEAVYFLSLGNLAPHKNFEGLIKGYNALMSQERPDAYLVVVGRKGPGYEQMLAQAASEERVQKRIIFTGRVADEDLAALYSGALSFVFMSHYEGFGLPPLEAMQCGAPIITSNTSSLPEVVGTAGITLDPNDTDALCQAMLRVFQDSDLRTRMSEKSLRQASRFGWDRCVQQTIQGYTLALSS